MPAQITREEMDEMMAPYVGKHSGQKCLLVGGGTSGAGWKELAAEVKPDIVIGMNATKIAIPNLDYWLCHENMERHWRLAKKGEAESIEHMRAWQTPGPKVGFLNKNSYQWLEDKRNMYPIYGCQAHELTSFRRYNGLLCGPWIKQPNVAQVEIPIGTVASRALHLAGILGFTEVHSIGFDLCFKDDKHHHWYEFPLYHVEAVRTEKMFVEYLGLKTQWIWIETAQWLLSLIPKMEEDGMHWTDHSEGLMDRLK